MPREPMIYNPQLQGKPFFWQGGPIGVLLVHGFTATTAEVRLLGKILHDHGYTIRAPLLPGHYTHPEDLNNVSWRDWVSEVETGYQELKSECDRIFVGGESTGALLALYLASKHPEAVGVLAYAPALKLNISLYNRLRLHLLAPIIPYVPKASKDENLPWQGYPVNPLKGTLQLLKLQQAVYRLLPLVHQPVLIVQGRLDETVHPSVPGTIASRVGSDSVSIHWMRHSSHVVIIDKELDQVARITLDFLQHADNPQPHIGNPSKL
ncbi:MAG: alpha/beta hydrolase [Anaerolineales bacterium]